MNTKHWIGAVVLVAIAFYLGAKNPGWLAKVPVVGS